MSLGAPGLARRYARALSELAKSAGVTDPVGASLSRFAECWTSSDELRTAFSSPDLGQPQRKNLLEDLGSRLFLEDLVLKTLLLLSDRRRMAIVPDLAEAYFALAEMEKEVVKAEVTTAARLSEAYFEELQRALEKVTGKHVSITRNVDPSLLGGVVTKVGDKVFDGSLRTRLDELEEELLLA